MRELRARKVAPARNRENCFRERGDVREDVEFGATVEELGVAAVVEVEEFWFCCGVVVDIVVGDEICEDLGYLYIFTFAIAES